MTGLVLGSTIPAWVLVATITETQVYNESPGGPTLQGAAPYPGPTQYILPSAETPTPAPVGTMMAAGAYTVLTEEGVAATAAPGVTSPASTWYVWRTYTSQPTGTPGIPGTPGTGGGTTPTGDPTPAEEPTPSPNETTTDPTPTPTETETPTPTPTETTPDPTPTPTETETPTETPTETSGQTGTRGGTTSSSTPTGTSDG
jgi:hypothetical protein